MLSKADKLDSLKTAVSIVKEYAGSADAGKHWTGIPDLLEKVYDKLKALREDAASSQEQE